MRCQKKHTKTDSQLVKEIDEMSYLSLLSSDAYMLQPLEILNTSLIQKDNKLMVLRMFWLIFIYSKEKLILISIDECR